MNWITVLAAFVFILILAVVSAIVGFVFYLLYNMVMPSLFSWPEMSFLQAWVITWLISIIGNLLTRRT